MPTISRNGHVRVGGLRDHPRVRPARRSTRWRDCSDRSKNSSHMSTVLTNAARNASTRRRRRRSSSANARAGHDDRLAQADDEEQRHPLGHVRRRAPTTCAGSSAPCPAPRTARAARRRRCRAATTQSTSRVVLVDERAARSRTRPDTLSQTVIRTKFCAFSGQCRPIAHTVNSVRPTWISTNGTANSSALSLERLRDRARHQQAQQHEDQQHRADRHLVGVQPVGHPRGVDPQPPDRPAEHQRLQRAWSGRGAR